MKGYGQYCPVAKAAEVVAERWTPLVLREILTGSHTFNEIQRGVPLMSRSLLSKRLKELQRNGIIERLPGKRGPEYQPTEAGSQLLPAIIELGVWALRWLPGELSDDELDPRPLMWHMRGRIHVDRLPDHRVNVQFDFTDVPRQAIKRCWLVLNRAEVDVCYKDPGFDVDLIVTTGLHTLTRIWLGRLGFAEAVRRDAVRVDGPRKLAQAFPRWLALSPLAEASASVPSPA